MVYIKMLYSRSNKYLGMYLFLFSFLKSFIKYLDGESIPQNVSLIMHIFRKFSLIIVVSYMCVFY